MSQIVLTKMGNDDMDVIQEDLDSKSKIDKWLKSFSGKTINLCYELYNIIIRENNDDQYELVSHICNTYGSVDSEKTIEVNEHISEKTQEELKEMYGEYVDELLKVLLKKAYLQGFEEYDFYHVLWDSITDSKVLSDEESKVFALYYILIDRRIPYYYIKKGMLMDNGIYRKYQEHNKDVIRRLRFVLSSSYGQKTEEASIILDELTNLDNLEDQVVVLAAVIGTLRNETKRAIDKIKKLLDELT